MERLARRCCADAGLRRSPMQREANAEPIPKGNSIPRVCRQRRHKRRANPRTQRQGGAGHRSGDVKEHPGVAERKDAANLLASVARPVSPEPKQSQPRRPDAVATAGRPPPNSPISFCFT